MRLASAVWACTFFTLLAGAHSASAGGASGAGATFPFPIYAKWAEAYRAETSVAISYQPIGSGLGIKMIQDNTVTFGASDMPLKQADLDASGLIQFPTVVGGDVPVVNLPQIANNEMTLDGRALADIFLGKIKRWDDAAIKRLNPGIALPPTAITVVCRSDGSGTTFIWTDYLSKQSADWKKNVGANTLVDWPVGLVAKGNDGVAQAVAQTSGAIGYVEFAYAVEKGLHATKVLNREGVAATASLDSFRTAAASAEWANAPGFYIVLTDQPGRDAWPIAGATFILMHKAPQDVEASNAALKFFKWAYEKGGGMATALNYVPLPSSAVERVEASWRQIQGVRAQ